MAALRVRLHLGTEPGGGILGMVGYSIAGHILFLFLLVFLPRVIPHQPPMPAVLTASIVSMPASAPPGAPPPKAAPEGPTPEERAEIAARKERVVKKPPEEKPPEKKAEPAPKPDKTVPPPPDAKKKRKKKEPPRPEPVPETKEAPSKAQPEQAPGPAGPISQGVGLGAGSESESGIPSINSASFPYQYYRTTLVNLIRSHWNRPLTPGLTSPLRCAVAFVISKSGQVSDVGLSVPSGFPPLDDSAVDAVLEAAPLPPLPYQYSTPSVRAEMIFELTPD